MSFIHLHTHSAYSFLEALPFPAELAQAAAQAGMPALALTDHTTLTGSVEFYSACRAAGAARRRERKCEQHQEESVPHGWASS